MLNLLTQEKADHHKYIQQKFTQGSSNKDSKISDGNVKRIQTILHEKKIVEMVEKAKKTKKIPKELKPRLTRKLRRGLTLKQIKMMNTGKPKKVKRKIFTFVE